MTLVREQITTSLPIDEAFDFVADFSNSMLWDPGVATSRQIGEAPLGVGARYQLGVRVRGNVQTMEYVITTFEHPRRVVLTGTGSSVSAVDDILFEATPDGTRIDYTADIRLRGLLRLAEPFAGKALAKIGRDALDGMRRALDERAARTTRAAASASPTAVAV